ncbi:MAG: hypothetical protein ACQEXJ_20615 [Myxococcota bacterium]
MSEAWTAERVRLPDEPGCLFPSDEGVVAHRYRPRREGRRSRVGLVVLPIQGGDYEVSTHFAEGYAKAGFRVLRFERRAEWLDAARPLRDLARLVVQSRRDVRRAMGWWLDQPDGPERLGLFGVSMGAGIGSAVAGVDDRIGASVLCIGGTGMAEVLTRTRDAEVRAWRDEVSRRLGLSVPALRTHLQRVMGDLDPHHDAAGMDPSTTLFVAARFDRVIFWPNSRRLWEAIGRPRRVVLPTGHYSAAAFVPFIRAMSRRWFDRHLL